MKLLKFVGGVVVHVVLAHVLAAVILHANKTEQKKPDAAPPV